MQILLAPTAYKGSFSPAEIAIAMRSGVEQFSAKSGIATSSILLPIADGGDGTVESIHLACGGNLQKMEVLGAVYDKRIAEWLVIGDTAIVELASACGIAGLEKGKLAPMLANTRGLGIVIRKVLENTDIKNIVIAVGGSASTDGGSGALYELGAKFFDGNGNEFCPEGGGDLSKIKACDLHVLQKRFEGKSVSIASDVENPLLGPNGAAAIFAPQKGATAEQIILLDKSLGIYANVLETASGRDIKNNKATGAAGGTSFGFAVALGSKLISGFDWLANIVSLEDNVCSSQLVISGEGRIDKSTMQGKAVGSLGALCNKFDKPFWILGATIAPEIDSANLKAALLLSASNGEKLATLQDVTDTLCENLLRKYAPNLL